jgi:hypothetical protein
MSDRRAALRLLAAAVVVIAAPDAGAYRPFDGTDAAVVAPGILELEVGAVEYHREKNEDFLRAPRIVANLGLVQDLELVAEATHLIALDDAAASGLRDPAFLLKGILVAGTLQGGNGPSVAAEGGVLAPDADGASGTGAIGLLIVSAAGGLGAFHVTTGLSRTRDANLAWESSLIAEGPARWRIRPVGEVFVGGEAEGDTSLACLAGGIWSVADRLSIDLAARYGRSGTTDAFEIRAGFTWGLTLLPKGA